jgi:hypothetical protein
MWYCKGGKVSERAPEAVETGGELSVSERFQATASISWRCRCHPLELSGANGHVDLRSSLTWCREQRVFNFTHAPVNKNHFPF